ncbi:tRNA (guanine-N(1)-)-methyltransferase [Candidatus Jettenia caeni]|uniref:tRNA (guanine-N(1)-)-methyltransferase n=1 Tax=Candidatus Jettenia caeni TaxID=247490 RepID=I3IH32_9BACT|nr:tRNA (guanosine(37)-N1)-methyltransferase TrmD [Candidatus Jettenia sp. AMX1]NUN22500.1 tRNA (guanosine(37)-N1)-methyltransferase TrmD [Candidatus Jettenia caeni]KAA0249305.1 MAG: tRNA (guanosine(37)-N1)-methyltransferase TrmD [Candidatus Jettenia sp. AMX1]MDL1939755.1 tRNA (guanosine(37)-N1)-methyltransferase TrmD [Candidatus Jettenia sp. AMX1]WKZ16357.1 MAG: tRNA (guanosine(37)-N1)-methyltransferase TrmD [Candidatus Jettenia caeni]GAB61027.1 tRNA (guanine-N(1)-)-methyltransferase [Candida
MRIDILTLFPEMFENVLGNSILKIAREKELVHYNLFNIREYAENKRCVDDRPYGGGPGMVMKPEPIFNSVEFVEQQAHACSKKILLTPQGRQFSQSVAMELSKEPYVMLICGHYEGFDERVRIGLDVLELSIGDYILSGGEIPAMVIIDAVVRLIPGVLGDMDSTVNESFHNGLLEHPQYTRPAEYRGMRVPEVLMSGHHQKIKEWQKNHAVKKTLEKRPDLLQKI